MCYNIKSITMQLAVLPTALIPWCELLHCTAWKEYSTLPRTAQPSVQHTMMPQLRPEQHVTAGGPALRRCFPPAAMS